MTAPSAASRLRNRLQDLTAQGYGSVRLDALLKTEDIPADLPLRRLAGTSWILLQPRRRQAREVYPQRDESVDLRRRFLFDSQ